jgi:transposase
MNGRSNVTQVGLDVHRKFSTASLRDASGRVIAREKLQHLNRSELKERIATWPQGTPVILEGSFGWGWISDELLALKMDPHLASSRKVGAWRAGRGLAKSNNLDADLLGELWNEKPTIKHGRIHRWWEVWLAPQEVRDQRELLRHRMGLVQIQTVVKNRVHAVLHRHGVIGQLSDLFGVTGRRMLQMLADDEQLLRESARRNLKDLLILLDTLRRLIARLTREFRATVRRSETGRRLTTLPGVSTVLGYTIAAEIGKIERFPTPRARRLGHAGRTTLQWAWIQAAHGAVKKDASFRAIFNRRTDNGKQDRGRGYIVVANRMCRIAYAMWKKQTDYQEVPPARPGSKQTLQNSSRPGTGQPLAAMATDLNQVREATV